MSGIVESKAQILKDEIGRAISRARNIIYNHGMYSNFSEEKIAADYLRGLGLGNLFVVDIAAQDGRTMSNTYRLYLDGASGIAVEADDRQFAKLSRLYSKFKNVALVNEKITPSNVNSMLKKHGAPKDFSFLNLDIDSYDYYILESILSKFRPFLICAEINEIFPPPIKFSVKYSKSHEWKKDGFSGQSLSMLCDLAKKRGYDLVELHYNNAFLIPRELNKWPALWESEAYDRGYRNMPNRAEKFPWNASFDEALGMNKKEALKFFAEKFKKYKGRFVLK